MRLRAASTACRRLRETRGQSTVEFAVVMAALLCIAIGLGALWHVMRDGLFVSHAITCASHNLSGAPGSWLDVFAY